MSNEIRVSYPTDATLYAMVFNVAAQVWYVVGAVFEAYGTSGRGADDYDIAVPEINAPSGAYRGTFPALPADTYITHMHLQSGVNPANQPIDTLLFGAQIEWGGASGIVSITYLPEIIHRYDGL